MCAALFQAAFPAAFVLRFAGTLLDHLRPGRLCLFRIGLIGCLTLFFFPAAICLLGGTGLIDGTALAFHVLLCLEVAVDAFGRTALGVAKELFLRRFLFFHLLFPGFCLAFQGCLVIGFDFVLVAAVHLLRQLLSASAVPICLFLTFGFLPVAFGLLVGQQLSFQCFSRLVLALRFALRFAFHGRTLAVEIGLRRARVAFGEVVSFSIARCASGTLLA